MLMFSQSDIQQEIAFIEFDFYHSVHKKSPWCFTTTRRYQFYVWKNFYLCTNIQLFS